MSAPWRIKADTATLIRCTNRLSGILHWDGIPGGPRVRYPVSTTGTPNSLVPTVTGVVHLYAVRGVVYGPDIRSE